MTSGAGAGVRHLRTLAHEPRPAGSDAEARARAYAATVLQTSGFSTEEREFEYSAFVGVYGLALLGAVVTLTLLATLLVPYFTGVHRAVPFGIGITISALLAQYLRAPRAFSGGLMRRRARNLVARRPGPLPAVWLVAHLDTKSQPIPSAVRALCSGVVVLLVVVMFVVAVTVGETQPGALRTVTWVLAALVLAAGLPLSFCVTGHDSNGAVDNASGVAAVLAAAEQLDPARAVGVLLTSAEELGMAGAEAWVSTHEAGVAINCDGVDDVGRLTIMHNAPPSGRLLAALRGAASQDVRIMRMPFGILTDSTVLQRARWDAVTVSHGSLATLRRIHRPADTLDALRGASIDATARVLARAAERLAS